MKTRFISVCKSARSRVTSTYTVYPRLDFKYYFKLERLAKQIGCNTKCV